MKILVTGFEPFDGDNINPSFEAVKSLDNNIEGAEIVKASIPVVFGKSALRLEEYINDALAPPTTAAYTISKSSISSGTSM